MSWSLWRHFFTDFYWIFIKVDHLSAAIYTCRWRLISCICINYGTRLSHQNDIHVHVLYTCHHLILCNRREAFVLGCHTKMTYMYMSCTHVATWFFEQAWSFCFTWFHIFSNKIGWTLLYIFKFVLWKHFSFFFFPETNNISLEMYSFVVSRNIFHFYDTWSSCAKNVHLWRHERPLPG